MTEQTNLNEKQQAKLTALFSKQRTLRDKRDMDQAAHLLGDIQFILLGACANTVWAALSRAAYEAAEMQIIKGEYFGAQHDFIMSARYAEQAGDPARQLIGDYRNLHTRYTSGVISAKAAFDGFMDLRQRQRSIASDIDDGNRGAYDSSVFNVLKQALETAFEIGDAQFERLVDEFLDHEWLREDKMQAQRYYRLHYSQAVAYKEASIGNFGKAASISAGYLDVTLDGVEPDNVLVQSNLNEMTHEHIQQIARDYRDLGRWLLQCDIPNKEAQALKVWKRGLEVPDIFGNRRFLADLREEVANAA